MFQLVMYNPEFSIYRIVPVPTAIAKKGKATLTQQQQFVRTSLKQFETNKQAGAPTRSKQCITEGKCWLQGPAYVSTRPCCRRHSDRNRCTSLCSTLPSRHHQASAMLTISLADVSGVCDSFA